MMWIFTPKGFYSVVQKGDNPDELTIRTRVRKDLENLRREHIPDLKIVADAGSDYRYRAVVERRLWLNTLVELGDEITYSNFKNEVAARQGKKRARAYEDVWWVLLKLQPVRRFRGIFDRMRPIHDEDFWADLPPLEDDEELDRKLEEAFAVDDDTGALPSFR